MASRECGCPRSARILAVVVAVVIVARARARAIRPRPALASAWGRLGTLRGRRKPWRPLRTALGEFRGEDSMCFYSSQIVPI